MSCNLLGKSRSTNIMLFIGSEGNNPSEKLGYRLGDNAENDFGEIQYKGINWI